MAGAFIDLTGQTFGKLRVIRRHPENLRTRNGKTGRLISAVQWECLCACGKPCLKRSGDLKKARPGLSPSCGCGKRAAERRFKAKAIERESKRMGYLSLYDVEMEDFT